MTTTNGDATKHFAAAAAAVQFDPTAAMQYWKNEASRFGRANEELVRGFTSAARMQVELGQELIQSQMSAFKQISPSEKPEAILKGQITHLTEETEHLFDVIRKISDEIRHSFTEATRTLLETDAPAPSKSVTPAATKPDFILVRKSASTALETRQSS